MKRFLILIALAILLGIPFLPVSYQRVIREGTDRYETHHALWGKRVKTVTATTDSSIQSIGLLLVNMRRSASLAPAHVRILVDSKGEVATGALASAEDDEFAWFAVPSGALQARDTYTIEVSAPDATQESPVGVRFDEESKELALAVSDKIYLYEYVLRWQDDNPDIARKFFTSLFGGVVLAIVLYSVEALLLRTTLFPLTASREAFGEVGSKGEKYAISSPRMRGGGVGSLWVISLCILFVYAVAIRMPLSASIDSAYGGDAFNYLLKSRALIDGEDPFAADPRKAPLYSLLVAPGLADPFDAVVWERWVSMLSAGGAVVLVTLFLRNMGVPFSIALAGGALLAVNRDFRFESVQGLANSLYAFLVLAAAYLFYFGRPYLVAVFTALATLTRYEGGAVAAVLVPASLYIEKISHKAKWRTLIPIAILLAIPFIMVPFSHSIGVRSIADIQGDEGLYVAYSLEDFSNNLKSFKNFFGRLWILTVHIGKPFEAFGIGVVVGAIWLLVHITPSRSPLSKGEKYAISSPHWSIPYLLILFVLIVLVRGSAEQASYLVQVFSALAGMGVGIFVVNNPKRSIPILIMIAVQIIAITAILPKTRYYLPIVPFTAMAVAGGAYVFAVGGKSSRRTFGSLLLVCVLIFVTYADAREALPGQVSDYNEKSAGQTVLLQSARYMKNVSGVVAAVEESDLQFRTYLPAHELVIFPDSLRDTDAQYKKLTQSGVQYISETTGNPYFAKLIEEQPDKFEEVALFTTKWDDVSSKLYRVY